jgi:hypothetical protein
MVTSGRHGERGTESSVSHSKGKEEKTGYHVVRNRVSFPTPTVIHFLQQGHTYFNKAKHLNSATTWAKHSNHHIPYLSPHTILKSKWIKDLNIKPDTLNLIEKKVRNCLELIEIRQLPKQNTNSSSTMINN